MDDGVRRDESQMRVRPVSVSTKNRGAGGALGRDGPGSWAEGFRLKPEKGEKKMLLKLHLDNMIKDFG
jgi:hypothetical protein